MIAAFGLWAALAFGAPSEAEARADQLVREGAALGEKGQWDEAIARFRAAEREFPRAIHLCNIGLAHARAGRPEHALFHLGRCRARATEVLPGWVNRTLDEARAQLARGDFAPLELVGAPGVTVTVDTYPEDPLALPVTVWLPFGAHQLRAEAHGFVTTELTLEVRAKTALRQELTLAPEPPPVDPDPIEPDPIEPPPPDPDPDPKPVKPAPDPGDPRLPAWITLGVGGAGLVTGAIFYGLALDSKHTAETFELGPDFEDASSTFRTQRDLAYGFLIGGAVVAATGGVLAFVLDDDADVTLVPAAGGAVVSVGF